MKNAILAVLVIVSGLLIKSFAHAVEPEVSKVKQCPDWDPNKTKNTWKIENEALSCRAECTKKQDCASSLDPCGRVMFYNKSYSDQIKLFLKQGSNFECSNRFDFGADLSFECKNSKCEAGFGMCEQDRKKLHDYTSSHVSTKCSTDADCTFFLSPDETCARRLPASSTGDFQSNQLNISYLREAVLHSCKMKNIQECDSTEKSLCLLNQCTVLPEKPKYKNFLNFEGPKSVANYQSNTIPVKMPPLSQSKCNTDQECSEVVGICSQYIVSLNKKFSIAFKTEIEKKEKSFACANATKIQIPKSKCVKKFCSFVN